MTARLFDQRLTLYLCLKCGPSFCTLSAANKPYLTEASGAGLRFAATWASLQHAPFETLLDPAPSRCCRHAYGFCLQTHASHGGRNAFAHRHGGHTCRVDSLHSRRVDQVLTKTLWLTMTLGVLPQVAWGQFCGQTYGARIADIHQQADRLPANRPNLLLTGSSSIRLWPDASSAFPQFDVINAGFGGSCYSDLWALRDTLLFAFEPDVVIIYEGDNDLSDGLPQSEILRSANALFADIARRLPDTKVVVLAPKPSLARSQLSGECKRLSEALRAVTLQHDFAFVDFWDAMHLANGRLNSDLFVGDGLHLNREGYDVWVETLRRELPWLAPGR